MHMQPVSDGALHVAHMHCAEAVTTALDLHIKASLVGTGLVLSSAHALEFLLLVEIPTILTKWPSLIGPFLPS